MNIRHTSGHQTQLTQQRYRRQLCGFDPTSSHHTVNFSGKFPCTASTYQDILMWIICSYVAMTHLSYRNSTLDFWTFLHIYAINLCKAFIDETHLSNVIVVFSGFKWEIKMDLILDLVTYWGNKMLFYETRSNSDTNSSTFLLKIQPLPVHITNVSTYMIQIDFMSSSY